VLQYITFMTFKFMLPTESILYNPNTILLYKHLYKIHLIVIIMILRRCSITYRIVLFFYFNHLEKIKQLSLKECDLKIQPIQNVDNRSVKTRMNIPGVHWHNHTPCIIPNKPCNHNIKRTRIIPSSRLIFIKTSWLESRTKTRG